MVCELDWEAVDASVLDEVEADTYYCISRLLDGIQDHYTTDQPGIQRMVKKLAGYKTLTGRKKAAKANPKIAALQVELAHVDGEIEKLVDSLTGANNVLLSYVNVKIAELDGRKQELLARIAELTVEAISPEQVSQISGYLDTWENVSFDDKRRVVDLMITTIAATSDSLNITWKI